MEIKVVDENGVVEKHEVTEDFMNLCFQQAKVIAINDNGNPDNIIKQIEDCTSNDVQRSIIADMVLNLLAFKAEKLLLKRLVEEIIIGD